MIVSGDPFDSLFHFFVPLRSSQDEVSKTTKQAGIEKEKVTERSGERKI